MSHQTFFLSPKFNKKSIFHSPTNKSQEFVNAYVYSIMVKNGNGIPNRADICSEAAKEPLPSAPREDSHPPLPTLPAIRSADPILEISVNASAQRKVVNEIKIAEKKISEFEQIYNISTDYQFRHDTYLKIGSHQAEIESNRKRIIKLKRNADYAQKCKEKKRKILHEDQMVILYDKPGRPPFLFEHPNLHDHIHDLIEFGAADKKRRKEVIKPQIKAHHHPAWVSVAGVSHTETRDHSDGHYCLASTKYARQFATAFADNSVVISQDDKVKIGLGVPAVGNAQKLVLSVYLITKPNESNDELQTEQLAIFVRHQWSLGTSSLTHMQDLESLVLDPQYDDVLKTGGEIRPIWVLLVDERPDENPRHLKNIKIYCQLFQKGMATLSGKLADIILPIDHFGSHLNTQVNARYVEELSNPFENLEFEGDDSPECFVPWSWIENHCNLCQYSLDIKHCTNTSCCGPPRAKEAMDFLFSNNGFLPPVTKAKDGHFTNAIHLLEYFDLMKIPEEQNLRVLDDFSLLPSQQKQPLFDETYLRDCMSDKE
ncbi:hypothetical protein GLOIN_2v1766467 [Rhizophagus irregularis DAOM 181602=DAOM 197198]|nr:hypothetical protein GLOIN_2v1766467 [Rhizophagus irregularis DAOM 181602=DAOM 197198]